MIYTAVALALLAATGVQSQCVAESNGVTYTYCGQAGPLNIYWTPREDNVTAIIFEAPDDGWYAFGFGGESDVAPMIGSQVLWGCDDFDLDDINAIREASTTYDVDLLDDGSPWDSTLLAKSGEGVAAGFATNLMANDGTITQTREDGICAVRWERDNIIDELLENQWITDAGNTMVVATGSAAALAVHTARTAVTQNFLDGTGDIADNPVVAILDGDDIEVAEGSASLVSVSTSLVGAAAALTAALW